MTTGFATVGLIGGWLLAQGPGTPEPRMLPGTIVQSPPMVTPASSSTTAIPNDRFKNGALFAPETMQCVYGLRAGGDWLGKIHQSHGKMLAGVNPALASIWPHDSDAKQALALWGLATAARFTGDAGLNAKAQQTLLTLFATIKPDTVDAKRMVPSCSEADAPVFAAAMILSLAEMPTVDERSQVLGEHMAASLANPAKKSPFAQALVMRAMAVSHKLKPADWKLQLLNQMQTSAKTACDSSFDMSLAGGLMSVSTDQTTVFALADKLIAAQYDRQTVRGGFVWAGAFNSGSEAEPTFEMMIPVHGLIAATKMAKASGDLQRYAKYRQALLNSLMFARGLQATPESSSHFEPAFRNRSVVGGVRGGVTDAILRADATGLAISTFAAFAESGLEGRE